jgi:hypothetical protein
MSQPKITLELDIAELNVVMAGLGKLPYEASFQVVDVVRQQVAPQIQQDQQGSNGVMAAPLKQ